MALFKYDFFLLKLELQKQFGDYKFFVFLTSIQRHKHK